MPTTFANQINNLDIYAARAVADKDGNQLDTTYAKSADLATVATSGDYNDLSNKPTIPVDKIFVATYGTTTFAEIQTAFNAGKYVFTTVTALPGIAPVSADAIFPLRELEADAYALFNGTVSDLQDELVTDLNIKVVNGGGWSISHLRLAKSSSLATVATTGDYDDLTNKPTIPAAQVNSDWNAASGVAEILNKPANLVQDANYVHTDENFTSAEKSKLSGIAAGAEVNVQADWNEADSASDAYIQNKPTIPAAQVNSDWNAASGVAEILNKPVLATVATTGDYEDLSNKPTIRNVPVSTSSDATKVLTVDSSGEPYWADPSAGLFEAIYGQTSYSDIVDAVNAHKIVYCRISATGASRMAFLAYIGASNVEFQYYRSLSSHSAADQTDEVYVYKVSSTGWTTTTRLTGIKYAAGTHMTSSFYNNTLTFQSVWPTVDQTYDGTSSNAQSGTAVAGALATKEDAFDVGTGLKMDTSGSTRTLQVEAPVDIVAGPGIVIDNPDGNTLRVSQQYPTDETVLFSGSSVATNIILSEAPNNFAYIRVEFRRSTSLLGFVSSVTLPVNSSSVSFPLMLVYSNVDNNTTYNEFIVRYNGNTTQTTFTFQYALKRTSIVGGSVTIAADTAPTLEVFKIVGIHRISGGN